MQRVIVESKEPNKETIFRLKTSDGNEHLYTENQALDVYHTAIEQAKFRLKCFAFLIAISVFNIFYVTKGSSFFSILQSIAHNEASLNITISIISNLVIFILIIPVSLIYYYFFQSCKDNIEIINKQK